MGKYIGFLRGINVSGHKKILMKDLKVLFESLGLTNIQTYIQSGNVVFETSEKGDLSLKISEAIEKKFGFDVPVLVKNASEIMEILENYPFTLEKTAKSYFILLNENPSEESIEEASKISFINEEFIITPNCVYLFPKNGYGNAKANNNFFERKLKVSATTRNYKTILKLVELASG